MSINYQVSYEAASKLLMDAYGLNKFEKTRAQLLEDFPGEWTQHMRSFEARALLTRVNDPDVTDEELTQIETRAAEVLAQLGKGKWVLWMAAPIAPLPDIHEYMDWHHVTTRIATIRLERTGQTEPTQKETTHD